MTSAFLTLSTSHLAQSRKNRHPAVNSSSDRCPYSYEEDRRRIVVHTHADAGEGGGQPQRTERGSKVLHG
eukprot:5190228-Prymnesium_polylepis.1